MYVLMVSCYAPGSPPVISTLAAQYGPHFMWDSYIYHGNLDVSLKHNHKIFLVLVYIPVGLHIWLLAYSGYCHNANNVPLSMATQYKEW